MFKRNRPVDGTLQAGESSVVRPPPALYAAVAGMMTLTALGLVLWRAWVADDAFITFRHVSNCLAGFGPVFNVGERVQGFTHPLWFMLLLAGATRFDVHAVAVSLGLAFTAGFMVALAWALRRNRHGLLEFGLASLVLLTCCPFVEFQTSGLENSLTHLLLAGLFLYVLGQIRARQAPVPGIVSLLAGLLILNRPDHGLLTLPFLIWLLFTLIRDCRWRSWWTVSAAFLPVLAWYGFATLYYGSPLPNTSYAKTAVSFSLSWPRGVAYAWDFASYLPIQAAVMAAVYIGGVIWAWREWRQRRPQAGLAVALVVSLWLQLGYVIAVGGDFMRGRFMMSAFVGAVLVGTHLLDTLLPRRDLRRPIVLGLACLLALVCYIKFGWFNFLFGVAHGLELILNDAICHPAIVFCLACVVLVYAYIVLKRFARLDASGAANRLFVDLMMVQGLYVIAAYGEWFLSWPVLLLAGAAMLWSCYLAGLWVTRKSGIGTATILAGLLLAMVVGSACDVTRRDAYIEAKTGIADEYAWYRKISWKADRFHENERELSANLRYWIGLGDAARVFAERHGPLAIGAGAIGFISYHAGPNVHVVDCLGLTDAYIARMPGNPYSRPGHIKRKIPRGYMESKGVISVLRDWQPRLLDGDPTLAEQAEGLKRDAHWDDPEALRKWRDIQVVISGDIFSWRRFKLLPAFIFSSP